MTLSEKLTTIAENTPKVYAAGVADGRKEEYNAFWESALKGRTVLSAPVAMFAGEAWNDDTFNPPNILTLNSNCSYVFYGTGITDLNGKVDVIAPTNGTYMFAYSPRIKHICTVDFRACTSSWYAFYTSNIVSIKKILVSASTAWHETTFGSATSLESAIFEGVIGTANLTMSACTKLSKESIESIINCLSATTSGLSVTLSLAAVNKAFETSVGAADGATSAAWAVLVATKTNWTITLA